MTQTWESVKSLPRRCYSPGVINYRNKLYVIGGVSMTDDTSQSQKVHTFSFENLFFMIQKPLEKVKNVQKLQKKS